MTTAAVGLALGLGVGVVLGVLYGSLIGIEPRQSLEQTTLSRAPETAELSSKAVPVSSARRPKAWELPVAALVTALGLTMMPALAAWLQARGDHL